MTEKSKSQRKAPVVGLALGSGAARGWAHIGIIQQLSELGIKPDIICGTSTGALVGALYASNNLKILETFVRGMDKRGILRYLDINLLAKGGFIEGKRLIEFFSEPIGDINIEELPIPFSAVATDLTTGHEVWLREGSLTDAIRASIALPGLFTPVKLGGKWLVDGGLVNPVPISLCRALGAEIVIAVNLNGSIAGKHMQKKNRNGDGAKKNEEEETALNKLSSEIKSRASSMMSHLFESREDIPTLFDVIAGSINIMQDRITRSRMGGDPPDVMLAPRLAHLGLMEFDRGDEAIEEGRESVMRAASSIQELL